MRADKKILRTIFCSVISYAVASCAHRAPTTEKERYESRSSRSGYSAEPADFIGVFFEPGKPSEEMAILTSLSRTLGDSAAALEQDLGTISTFPPSMSFKVVGFTDSKECSATKCLALSLRRARLVHEWLIENGVPPERLEQPEGYGSSQPIGDNATESGRAKNRRAYIIDQPAASTR